MPTWKGWDGENQMNEEDWQQRALDQAMHMREGGDWRTANVDSEGTPTAGCYNGDYTQEQHDAANAALEEDANAAVEQGGMIADLWNFLIGNQD